MCEIRGNKIAFFSFIFHLLQVVSAFLPLLLPLTTTTTTTSSSKVFLEDKRFYNSCASESFTLLDFKISHLED